MSNINMLKLQINPRKHEINITNNNYNKSRRFNYFDHPLYIFMIIVSRWHGCGLVEEPYSYTPVYPHFISLTPYLSHHTHTSPRSLLTPLTPDLTHTYYPITPHHTHIPPLTCLVLVEVRVLCGGLMNTGIWSCGEYNREETSVTVNTESGCYVSMYPPPP